MLDDIAQNALMQLLIWKLARQKVVEQHAAGIDIRPAVCLPEAELLGGGVACRTENIGVFSFFGLHQSADTEIDNFDASALVKHDIFGFDVTVNHAVLMQHGQSVTNLTDNIFRRLNPIGSVVFDQKRKRHAVNKFAKADADAVFDSDAVNRHQIRMTDAAKRFHNRIVLGCGNPSDHQLTCCVIAHQIDIAVNIADNGKAPKLRLSDLHIDLAEDNCYDKPIFYHKIREKEDET